MSDTGAKTKAPAKKPEHPPVATMVPAAIEALAERKGSSLAAIKKYVAENYKVDMEKLAPFVRKYLKKAVEEGKLIQTKGSGASGSFKLAKKTAEDKPKKAAAKKVTKEKKPKSPAKEKTQKKSPKPSKSPKAAATKKTAAKKTPTKATTKKTAAKKSPKKVAMKTPEKAAKKTPEAAAKKIPKKAAKKAAK